MCPNHADRRAGFFVGPRLVCWTCWLSHEFAAELTRWRAHIAVMRITRRLRTWKKVEA
jgi:hypothetical protein